MMDIQTVRQILGGEIHHGNTLLCAGVGHSAHDRSLSIWFDPQAPEGFVVHSFAGDDPLQARDHIKQRLGLSSRRGEKVMLAPSTKPCTSGNHSQYALKLWQEARRPELSLVDIYLRHRVPILNQDIFTEDMLRFHPACPYKHQTSGQTFRLPTMLAVMRDVTNGEPKAIHRTALQADGLGKAEMPDGGNPKRMLGAAKGCAVMLCTPTNELAICEGIETGLSLHALGITNIWCVGSAGAVRCFPVLDHITNLTIYADNDTNNAGAQAAHACMTRWRDAGKSVRAVQPRTIGMDWNNVLMEAIHA